jgi:hypothetical protein
LRDRLTLVLDFPAERDGIGPALAGGCRAQAARSRTARTQFRGGTSKEVEEER